MSIGVFPPNGSINKNCKSSSHRPFVHILLDCNPITLDLCSRTVFPQKSFWVIWPRQHHCDIRNKLAYIYEAEVTRGCFNLYVKTSVLNSKFPVYSFKACHAFEAFVAKFLDLDWMFLSSDHKVELIWHESNTVAKLGLCDEKSHHTSKVGKDSKAFPNTSMHRASPHLLYQ